jgi:hypothetical protein
MHSGTVLQIGTVLGANPDTLTNCTLLNKGAVVFGGTGTLLNQATRCTVSGVSGIIEFRGTTSGQVITDSTVDSGNIILDNVTGGTPTHQWLMAQGGGNILMTNVSVAKPLIQVSAINGGSFTMNGTATAGGVGQVFVSNGGNYNMTLTAGSVNGVNVTRGRIIHNGGNLTNVDKRGQGTLTTGAFNHTDIMYDNNLPQALTVANSGRGRDFFNNTLL